MESQFLSVIRAWAAMAWADGKIATQEAAALRRLIDGASLNENERHVALTFLERRVELDTAALKGLSEEARHGIYRAAVKLSRIDNDVATAEIALLERLREELGLDVATATSIEASVK